MFSEVFVCPGGGDMISLPVMGSTPPLDSTIPLPVNKRAVRILLEYFLMKFCLLFQVVELFLDNFDRYMADKPLKFVVDFEKGY